MPVAGGTFLHRVETTFVLPVIVPTENGKSGFRPDNLTAEFESGPLQRLLNLTTEQAGMPTVGDVSGKEHIRVCPIDPMVVLDLPFTTGGKRYFPGPGRSVSPRGVVVDAVRRVGFMGFRLWRFHPSPV